MSNWLIPERQTKVHITTQSNIPNRDRWQIKRENEINRSVALRCHFINKSSFVRLTRCVCVLYFPACFFFFFIELIFMNLWSNWMMIIQMKIDFVHNNLFGAILLLYEKRKKKKRIGKRPAFSAASCTWIAVHLSFLCCNSYSWHRNIVYFSLVLFQMMRYYFRSIDSVATKKRRCSSTIDDDYILLLPIKLIRYCRFFVLFFFQGLAQDRFNKTELLRICGSLSLCSVGLGALNACLHWMPSRIPPAAHAKYFFFVLRMCTNYLWLVAAATLHVRLFDAGFQTDQWNNNNALHLCIYMSHCATKTHRSLSPSLPLSLSTSLPHSLSELRHCRKYNVFIMA